MATIGIADRDRMDNDRLAPEPVDDRGPGADVVLAVREDDDGSPIGMFLFVERPDRRVQRSAQVGSARLDVAGSERSEDVHGGVKVIGQGASDHPSSGEGDDRRSVPSAPFERLEQAHRRLDRHAHPVRHGILGPHAPAGVDQQDHVVTLRRVRTEYPAPSRLTQGQDHQDQRGQPAPRTIAEGTARLTHRLPVLPPLSRASSHPRRHRQEPEEQPKPFRMGK